MSGEPTFRILVSDSVSPQGVELLQSTPGMQVTVNTGLSPEDLAGILGEHDALIVRSATKVTAEILKNAGRLRVIGRAGTGVDNIDLDAATLAGVVVINTPGGNSVAAGTGAILKFARKPFCARAPSRKSSPSITTSKAP